MKRTRTTKALAVLLGVALGGLIAALTLLLLTGCGAETAHGACVSRYRCEGAVVGCCGGAL